MSSTRDGAWIGRWIWLTAYVGAMAYLESAVVVYLRAIYYPDGFELPLVLIDGRMAEIEVGREAATLVMLGAVGVLTGRDRWERFLVFALAFGVWDILYYVWLWVFLGWPASPLTWDVLFLIPVPWIGPVLAPVLISVALVVGSWMLLRLKHGGYRLSFSPGLWAVALAGGLVVLLSFMFDFRVVLDGGTPPPFRWGLFLVGFGMAVGALAAGIRGLTRPARA